MIRKYLVLVLVLSCILALGNGSVYAAPIQSRGPSATLLVTGMQSGSGSTIGPDGALYVTEVRPAGCYGSIRRPDGSRRSLAACRSGSLSWVWVARWMSPLLARPLMCWSPWLAQIGR